MSKQEDLHRPEKPFEKTGETDNEARISKEPEMNRKFRSDNSVRHPAKLSNILGISKTHQFLQRLFKYIKNIFWLLKGKTSGIS